MRFKYHATYTILDLNHLCAKAVRNNQMDKATNITRTASALEALFPGADESWFGKAILETPEDSGL